MMSDSLARHLLKGVGIASVLLAIAALTSVVLLLLSSWLLRREGLLDPRASQVKALLDAFHQLARRKTLAVVAVVLACLLARAALIPILKVPAPKDHDEFSYLLAADTFAHGRLTNPTHPMWMHFETMHVNFLPTYMSMYPPGQGFVLTAGQLLGHPWIGVWLSTALACGLIVWMLQAWVPPKWALLGGVLAILQFGLLSYWANSYYCTSLPAIGGALALGAFGRLKRRPRAFLGGVLAFGVGVLALSRPYEGLVFSLTVAVALLAWMFGKRGPHPHITLKRVVAPAALVLAVFGAFLAYDNWRVSGNPLLMPYQINQRTYKVVSLFAWQPPRQPRPVYRHAAMRDFYAGWEVAEYRNTMTHGILHATWIKFERYTWFYFGPLLFIPLLALPWVIRDKRIRLLLIVAAVGAVGLDIETWSNPHYAAPMAAAIFAIAVQSMRHMYYWKWQGKQAGRAVVFAVVLGSFLIDAGWVGAMTVAINSFEFDKAIDKLVKIDYDYAGNQQRAAVLRKMQRMPGDQLVIVHYRPTHFVHMEWVYNRADIDHAKVVWARDMGEQCNEELISYFRNRHVWLVEADDILARVEPYLSGVAQAGSDVPNLRSGSREGQPAPASRRSPSVCPEVVY